MSGASYEVRCTAVLDGCAATAAALRRPCARGLRAANGPESIRDEVQRRLDGLCKVARDKGLTEATVEAILLPLVALADEIALSQRDALATVWSVRPLQMHYFRENVAGEIFFSQLDAARRETRTHPLVLRAFFLCLCLGFRGRYALHGDPTELDQTRELLRDELVRRGLLRVGEPLSPHVERQSTPSAARARHRLTPWGILGVVTILLWVILGVQMIRYFAEVEQLSESLRDVPTLGGSSS